MRYNWSDYSSSSEYTHSYEKVLNIFFLSPMAHQREELRLKTCKISVKRNLYFNLM